MTNNMQKSDHEKRITSLETNMQALRHDVEDTRKEVHTIAEKLDTFTETIHEKFTQSQKPQYNVIFGFLGILIAIIGFIGSEYLRDVSRIEEEINKVSARFEEHRNRIIHTGGKELLIKLEKKIDYIRDRLDNLQIKNE